MGHAVVDRLTAQPQTAEEAAACIAGVSPAPAWLIEMVTAGAHVIRGNQQTQNEFPTRSIVRTRLLAIQGAASALVEEFRDRNRDLERYAPFAFLLDAGLDQLTINSLAEALPRLEATCAAARSLPEVGKGRHKTFPNDAAL